MKRRLSHRAHLLLKAYLAPDARNRAFYCSLIREADQANLWLAGAELDWYLRRQHPLT